MRYTDSNAEGRLPSTLPEKELVRLVPQELARHADPDPVALLVGLALHGHVEVDGAHDAVAELLLDQFLPGRAVDLHQLVEPGDQRIDRRHLSHPAPAPPFPPYRLSLPP